MRRTIAIETSYFSESPTKRWCYGSDCWEEDVIVEYPEELDHLDDEELLDMADEGDDVCYIQDDEPESTQEPSVSVVDVVN